MSTIVVTRVRNEVCIGADTLSTSGSLKYSPTYVLNKSKILKVGDSYLGLSLGDGIFAFLGAGLWLRIRHGRDERAV